MELPFTDQILGGGEGDLDLSITDRQMVVPMATVVAAVAVVSGTAAQATAGTLRAVEAAMAAMLQSAHRRWPGIRLRQEWQASEADRRRRHLRDTDAGTRLRHHPISGGATTIRLHHRDRRQASGAAAVKATGIKVTGARVTGARVTEAKVMEAKASTGKAVVATGAGGMITVVTIGGRGHRRHLVRIMG